MNEARRAVLRCVAQTYDVQEAALVAKGRARHGRWPGQLQDARAVSLVLMRLLTGASFGAIAAAMARHRDTAHSCWQNAIDRTIRDPAWGEALDALEGRCRGELEAAERRRARRGARHG